jgi:phosphoglycerate kinase
MFAKQSLTETDVAGRRVLVRVDFNVPLSDGTVTDDTRIRAGLPTIDYLVRHDARVILVSHLGRPKGTGFEPAFSLAPAVRVLERLSGTSVTLVDDIVGEKARAAVAALEPGEVLMLENVRFDAREKKNDPEFAQQLSSLAELYVNDAFGTAHRAHASTAGVAAYLPAYAGFLLSHEVETLTSMLEAPNHPFTAILGGSKVSDKIGVIDRLLDTVDTLIVGGGMVFTFLAAQGKDVGTSLCEVDRVDDAKGMLAKAEEKGVELLLPVDIVVADRFADDADSKVVASDEIPADMMGLDIGPTTCDIYRETIAASKTIFWNGPMGVFEMSSFENGTKRVAEAVAASRAVSIVGGGDSVAAIKQFGVEGGISFVSTGGGASMELLEGKKLPGVEALLDV